MRGFTYHEHALNGLSEREQEVVGVLVDKVQCKYRRYPALLDPQNPYTWHDALEEIYKDSLEFLQEATQLQKHEIDILSEAGTPLCGSTLRLLQTRAKAVRKWCKDVQRGLLKAEKQLSCHFNQAWAAKSFSLPARFLQSKGARDCAPR